jgi:electron transfer flavoprotein alpha subunit
MQRTLTSSRAASTLVLADHDNSSLGLSTLNTISAAKQIGGDITVLVSGAECKGVADEAAKLEGVSKVLVADSSSLEHPLAENLATVILDAQKANTYSHIVAGTSAIAKSTLPRVAACLDVSAMTDGSQLPSTIPIIMTASLTNVFTDQCLPQSSM